jgi:hypothetical protein
MISDGSRLKLWRWSSLILNFSLLLSDKVNVICVVLEPLSQVQRGSTSSLIRCRFSRLQNLLDQLLPRMADSGENVFECS